MPIPGKEWPDTKLIYSAGLFPAVRLSFSSHLYDPHSLSMAVISTPLTELFGIDHPVILA